jgi:hypothetical protein
VSRPTPLADMALERVLDGAADDAPPEYSAVAGFLAEVRAGTRVTGRSPTDQARGSGPSRNAGAYRPEARVVNAMVAAHGRARTAAVRRGVTRRAATALAGLGTAATVGLAASGALPAAAQQIAHDVFQTIGIQVPAPPGHGAHVNGDNPSGSAAGHAGRSAYRGSPSGATTYVGHSSGPADPPASPVVGVSAAPTPPASVDTRPAADPSPPSNGSTSTGPGGAAPVSGAGGARSIQPSSGTPPSGPVVSVSSGAPGQVGTSPGRSAGAPGQSGTAPGQSGSAPGSSTSAPGQSGVSPGQSGGTPGQSGTAPGQSGSAPGSSTSAPGQSGTSPGHSGGTPGPSDTTTGQATPASHQSTGTPGQSGPASGQPITADQGSGIQGHNSGR